MGHECPDPCHDEDGRERKRTLSIVPSPVSNFPSGLEGFSANPNHFPPSRASQQARSPMRQRGFGVGVGEEQSPEEGPSCDPTVEAVCAHQGQLAAWAADGESHMADGALGRKIQLEE